MKKCDFKKKFAEEVQSGLRGFVSNFLSKATPMPNGGIVVDKVQVDRWRKMLKATHYKAPPAEKEWANNVADNIIYILDRYKKNATKTPADPRVGEIKDTWCLYCKDLKGFKPVLNHGRDTIMIKKRLQDHTKEDILDCFDWFLQDDSSNRLSPTISTCLSAGVFNKFLSTR